MGIGHLAVGLGAKRVAPEVPLAWLLVAGVLLDLLWGVTILTGIEEAQIVPGITASVPLGLTNMPYTHSLVATVGWAALYAAIVAAVVPRGVRVRAAIVTGLLVWSHWALDVVAHRPDMPVGLHGPYLGLGLWNARVASIVVECAMVIAGAWLYLRATARAGGRGVRAVAITTVILVGVGVAGYLGPFPPSVTPIAVMNIATAAICVGLGILLDRRRAA
jgi:hypothetical protein